MSVYDKLHGITDAKHRYVSSVEVLAKVAEELESLEPIVDEVQSIADGIDDVMTALENYNYPQDVAEQVEKLRELKARLY